MTNFRPGRFHAQPMVVKNLIIINALVFLLQNVLSSRGINLDDYCALHYWGSPLFRWWQVITHMFMHGSIGHIFFNMFALWMFGRILENVWGPQRFLLYYLVCGLGAAFCHMGVLSYEFSKFYNANIAGHPFPSREVLMYYDAMINQATIGASGAVFGLLFAFGYLFPNTELMLLFPPMPIKAKWFVIIYAVFELYLGIQNSAGDNVAHFAHLGGLLFGFIMIMIWKKRRNDFY